MCQQHGDIIGERLILSHSCSMLSNYTLLLYTTIIRVGSCISSRKKKNVNIRMFFVSISYKNICTQ